MRTIVAASEVHSQLERRVESITFPSLASLTSAQVMDRVPRRLDELENLADPCFTGVASFGCDAGSQSEPYEAEQNGLKNRFVFLVERAIQEYVPSKFGLRQLDVYPFGGNESLP